VPVHATTPALRRASLAAAATAAVAGVAAGALAPAVPALRAQDATLAASARALRAVHLDRTPVTSPAPAVAPATSAVARTVVTRQSPDSESTEDS
jgi:hypothetical protein